LIAFSVGTGAEKALNMGNYRGKGLERRLLHGHAKLSEEKRR
jgi:hypothetical protein